MRNILRFHMLVVYLMAVLLPVCGNSQQQYAYSNNKSYGDRTDFSQVQTQDKQTLLSVLKELNKTDIQKLDYSMTAMMPYYAAWAVFISFIFPFIFWFK